MAGEQNIVMLAEPIKILFTGDLCPHNRIEKLALEGKFESVFNDFIDVFQGNDLNVTDLECPLTLSDKARAKIGPHQKAHPDCIGILKYANIGLVAMANNHIMDYGEEGARETIGLCRAEGIRTVGIGRGQEAEGREHGAEGGERGAGSKEQRAGSREPYVLEVKGKRIAILNFADNEFLTSTDGELRANPIDPVNNYYDIRKAKEENDFVILIVHGGNEFYNLPSSRIKNLCHFYIDQGVDAIISHHTHRFSGYEVYQGKPVFYGLGNFIYDWPGRVNTGWNQGYVVRLLIGEKIDFEIIPLKQGNEKPGVFHLNEDETADFNKELHGLNAIIADDLKLEAEFRKYCETVFPMYDAYIEPFFGRWITALQKRRLLPKLMTRRKRLLLLNLTRCESHREVLLTMLKKYE